MTAISEIGRTSPILPLHRIEGAEEIFETLPVFASAVSKDEISVSSPDKDISIDPFDRSILSPRLKEPTSKPSEESYIYSVLRVQERMCRLARDYCETNAADVETQCGRLTYLQKQYQDLLHLEANALQTKKSWGVWQAVSQYVSSATTFVVGMGCIASGTAVVPGCFLIAAAGLGLLNCAIKDTVGWEPLVSYFTTSKQLQTKIAGLIDIGLFSISIGLSLVGGINAWREGALTLAFHPARDVLASKAAHILAGSSTIMRMIAQAGLGLSKRKLECLHADLKLFESEKAKIPQKLQRDLASISDMNELAENFDRISKQAIASLNL